MTEKSNISDAHEPLCSQTECNQSVQQCENKTEPKISTEASIEPSKLCVNLSKALATDDGDRLYRIPWFILTICFMQVLIFFATNDELKDLLIFDPFEKWQIWRYLSYTLLHADLLHLALNICLQCFVGLILECEQGHWKVAIIYITGGISGSLATLIFQPQLLLLGASAGIYSLLMSHVPHLVKNFSQLSYRYFRIVALVVLWLSDAGFTVYHFLINNNENPRICLDAHIAGGITGLLMGLIIYERWHERYAHKGGEDEKILSV